MTSSSERSRRVLRLLAAVLICGSVFERPLSAHIGSPDVFVDTSAGPHRIYVTIRPPLVVPGVADVEVLATSDAVRRVRIVPLPLSGPGAEFAPVPDEAERSRNSPRMFVGHLWMMTAGAWQIRVTVDGDGGSGQVSVPVPALPQATRTMTRGVGVILFGFLLLLSAGIIAIVTAAVREASVPPGEAAPPRRRRLARFAGVATTAATVVIAVLGNLWWDAEAASYARYVYKPLEVTPAIANGELTLTLRDPGWLRTRRTDDFVLDHGHPMHLFVVSPSLDRLWHLHPEERAHATFVQRLPSMPAGRYELFGDLVHATGVPETVVANLDAPNVTAANLVGDDSGWSAPAGRDVTSTEFTLADGARVMWVREPQPLVTKTMTLLTFHIVGANGTPIPDLELYMGMPAHAVIVRKDRQVFAHVHPSGSAPMAALQIAQRNLSSSSAADPHAGHSTSIQPVVSFPYGFPQTGDYRIFVQFKRGGRIETAAFDARVQ